MGYGSVSALLRVGGEADGPLKFQHFSRLLPWPQSPPCSCMGPDILVYTHSLPLCGALSRSLQEYHFVIRESAAQVRKSVASILSPQIKASFSSDDDYRDSVITLTDQFASWKDPEVRDECLAAIHYLFFAEVSETTFSRCLRCLHTYFQQNPVPEDERDSIHTHWVENFTGKKATRLALIGSAWLGVGIFRLDAGPLRLT